jgi:23S rRNA U2552 (ribose-2'-O)-methylase RlmE/FtsJ
VHNIETYVKKNSKVRKKMKKYLKIMSLILISNISLAESISFREEYFAHKNYASDKWDNYLEIYETYLRPYINKNAHILEIGVQNGGFLQVLDKYLGNAKIYGIDIDPNVCKQNFGGNITALCFDATKIESLEKSSISNIEFDVIIDDASHHNKDVIDTFKLSFPKLKKGGVYIVEDVHTSYWAEYGGGYLDEKSSMEYFKHLSDSLNRFHIKENNILNGQLKNISSTSDQEIKNIVNWIESITFFDSVIVIKKSKEERSSPYKRISTGTIDSVVKVPHLKR